jgi:predicted ATPase
LGTPAQFQKRYSEDPNLQSVAADINSIEEEIELALKPREQLQKLISTMFTGAKEVSLEDNTIRVKTQDGSAIDLASLSSGEKHALRIFIDMLQAEESTLIIDEPEISLHVDWQRTLISNMRLINPLAQIIVATHSPEIMADVPDDKIFRL